MSRETWLMVLVAIGQMTNFVAFVACWQWRRMWREAFAANDELRRLLGWMNERNTQLLQTLAAQEAAAQEAAVRRREALS